MRVWRRTHLGSEADRATFRTLHTAALASPALREGLTTASAEHAVRHLRDLLGTPALAVTDTTDCLAWDGDGGHHRRQVGALVATAVDKGRTQSFGRGDLPCDVPGCPIRSAVVPPVAVPGQAARSVGDRQGRSAEEVAQVPHGALGAGLGQPLPQRRRGERRGVQRAEGGAVGLGAQVCPTPHAHAHTFTHQAVRS